MTLAEFLSIGLNHGQKCKVTIQNPSDRKASVYEVFFFGFRFYCYRTTGQTPDDIIPVFNEPTKNGKMSSKRFHAEYCWLGNIVNIEPLNPGQAHLTKREVCSLDRAAMGNDARCRASLYDIVREMNTLFPGKKILIQPGTRVCAIGYAKYDCYPVQIAAVYLDGDGQMVYDLSGDDYSAEAVPEKSVDPANSYAELLLSVLESIEDPVYGEESFIHEKTPWDAIPDVDYDKTPAIGAAKCMKTLKQNRWFDSLPLEKKQKHLAGFFPPENISDDGSATAAYCYELDPLAKEIIYNAKSRQI